MSKHPTECADDHQIPTKRLRFDSESGVMIEQGKSEPFLKGPIPLNWLNRVACLPGKAINVALAIRWLADMNVNGPIKLSKKSMALFNFSADAASDAIRRMEIAGLIKVARNPGQRPSVQLLPPPQDSAT